MRNEGIMQLIVQGMDRFEIVEWIGEQPYLKAKVQILPELRRVDDEEIEALKRNIQGMIQEALALLAAGAAGNPRRRDVAGQSRPARIFSGVGPRSRRRDRAEDARVEHRRRPADAHARRSCPRA